MFDRLFSRNSEVQAAVPSVSEIKTSEPSWYALYDPYQAYDIDGQLLIYRNLQPHEIVRHFENIAPVNAAVTKIARAVSGLPLKLVNKNDNTPVKEHPLLDLLRSPNPTQQQTRRSFIRDVVMWRILTGDTYILLTGSPNREPIEMYVLDPTEMQIHLDAMGFPERYTYSPRAGVQLDYFRDRKDRFINRENNQELLHFKNFSTRPSMADQGGMSELAPCYYEINQYLHAANYNVSLLGNGARPSGALIYKGEGNMDEKTYADVKNQINANFSGAANAGRPLLLEGDLDWKELAITPKDGDFRNVRLDAEESIYKTLEIPIGMVKSEGTTANNMKNLRHEFYQSRVAPTGDDVCEFINIFILPRYGDNTVQLEIDRDNIDVFIEERAEKRKIIENSTAMTINEKRKYFGDGPIDGGEKIVDPNGRPIAGKDAKGEIGFDAPGSNLVNNKPKEQPKPVAEDKPAG